MDKILKALLKLSERERQTAKELLLRVKQGDFSNLNLKKLKGFDNVFRARKGKIRIIYRQDDKGGIFILRLERRNDSTYNL